MHHKAQMEARRAEGLTPHQIQQIQQQQLQQQLQQKKAKAVAFMLETEKAQRELLREAVDGKGQKQRRSNFFQHVIKQEGQVVVSENDRFIFVCL